MICRLNILLCCLMLLLAAVSCGSGGGASDRFSRFEALPENGWAYGDSVTFSTSGLDSVGYGKISVALRHNDRFLYQNLWLEVSYNDVNGCRVCDSVNIVLADSHGRWVGKGIGSDYQCEVELPRQAFIPDSALISVRHIMRVDTLRGVDYIGVTVNE